MNSTERTAQEPADQAPELHAFHDAWFAEAEAAKGEIYGSPDEWSGVKRTGHFKRIELLDRILPADLSGKTAVDFGSGPWGFGCIAPKLRTASRCICIDVSSHALQISAEKDPDMRGKTTYLVSDGDSIPVPDSSVDVFWAGEVIEHVRHPARFMQEIGRVCRDGALVFMSTPNREALYYKARGEDYSIGPEHIALMNLAELEQVLRRMLSSFHVLGFETSLYPDLDTLLTDEADLQAVQRRAEFSPVTASGLLISGIASKPLYVKNCRSWEMREENWRQFSGTASEVEAVPLFHGVDGGSLSGGATISAVFEASEVVLLFWAHDWSGVAEVDCNGETRLVDLYSPHGGFRRVVFQVGRPRAMSLRIRRTGQKNAASASDQVIFYKAMAFRN